tara:strand:- start:1019 stop:1702 length:684 start_codon:yes stop_codon:yes gene_type:complete
MEQLQHLMSTSFFTQKWNVKTAWKEVGGLSKPSKMPVHGYSLPAEECNVGSKLRGIKNSTCEKCYALVGNYLFPVVRNALYHRLDMSLNNSKWVECMIFLILWYCSKKGIFRWHDSGDLQNLKHLEDIVYITKMTPNIVHWLPTREVGIVKAYKEKHGEFPPNLIVRISATMVNGLPHKFHKHSSTVVTDKSLAIDKVCNAPMQDNQCKDCRLCWDTEVEDVAYILH